MALTRLAVRFTEAKSGMEFEMGGPLHFNLGGRHAAALLCCHLQCVLWQVMKRKEITVID